MTESCSDKVGILSDVIVVADGIDLIRAINRVKPSEEGTAE